MRAADLADLSSGVANDLGSSTTTTSLNRTHCSAALLMLPTQFGRVGDAICASLRQAPPFMLRAGFPSSDAEQGQAGGESQRCET